MKDLIVPTYSIALTAIVGYLVWLLKKQKEDRERHQREMLALMEQHGKEMRLSAEAQRQGTMLLLRVQLIEYHSKYTAIGRIPSYAYSNFEEMYEAYHALGGNGMVEKMFQEIKELKISKNGGKES